MSLESIAAVEPLSRPFAAEVVPPGSKSGTNRALMLAALARGQSRIERPLRSADTDAFADALVACGVRIERNETAWTVQGAEGRPPGGAAVNFGDGGTPTRFMLALGSLARRPIVVDGSARMRERPVAEGVEILQRLGARAEYVEAQGRLPVRVGGGALPRGGAVEVGRTASSQFLSAALLAGPWMEEGTDLFLREPPTSASYVELSVDALRRFGSPVDVLRDGTGRLARVAVPPGPLEGAHLTVEPDASSAVYMLAAAALIPDARVTVRGLPRASKQPDMAVVAALVAMGAREVPVAGGTCLEGAGPLKGIDVDGSRWPDGALCVAALASAARGTTRIRGLETLRVKESDRIAALAEELAKLGCEVKATASSISIDPQGAHGRPVTIDPHNDHRVAMSFAVLGLARPGISIADPECVSKSYPGFWSELAALRASAR